MSENSIKANENLSVFDRAWFEVFPPLNEEDEALFALNGLYLGRALTFLGLQRGVGYLYLNNKARNAADAVKDGNPTPFRTTFGAVRDDNPTPFRKTLYSLAEKNFVRLTQLEPSSARLFFKVVPLVLFNYAVVAPATAVANFVALVTVFPVALVMNAIRRAPEKKGAAVPEVEGKTKSNSQPFNSGDLNAAFLVKVRNTRSQSKAEPQPQPQPNMLRKSTPLTKEESVYYGDLLERFIMFSEVVKKLSSVNSVNIELLQGLETDIEKLKDELEKNEFAREDYVYQCVVLMEDKVAVLSSQSKVPFLPSPDSPEPGGRFPSLGKK